MCTKFLFCTTTTKFDFHNCLTRWACTPLVGRTLCGLRLIARSQLGLATDLRPTFNSVRGSRTSRHIHTCRDSRFDATSTTYSSCPQQVLESYCAKIVFHSSTTSDTHPTVRPNNPPRIRHFWSRGARSIFRRQLMSLTTLQAGRNHLSTQTRCITASSDAFPHLFCIRTHLV
jgi:hypothetical protein